MQAGISLPSRAGLTQRSHSLVPAPEGEPEKLISSYAMNMQGIIFALSLSAAIEQGKKQLNGLMVS
jgi:hypothetical protein